MSKSLTSAAHALCLCSDMRGCLMGALFCFWGEGGLPRDPALFIYFTLCPACWVEKDPRLRQLWLSDEGLNTHQTHTHTRSHSVSSVLLWNRKHSWLHKGPFHQSSYMIWQPLELSVLSVVPSFFFSPCPSTHFIPPKFVFLSCSNLLTLEQY